MILQLIPVFYLLMVAAHAFIDSVKIKKGIVIRHNTESYFFAATCFLIFFPLLDAMPDEVGYWHPLPLILFPLLTRLAFFDGLLNMMINKPWLYEGVKKPKDKESWFDRLERNIGLPVWLYRLIYIVLYLSYLVIYL